MSAEFVAAIAAVDAYARAQGLKAADCVAEDGWDTLLYEWAVKDGLAAVRDAGDVVDAGATVTLTLRVDANTAVLASDAAGTWIPDGPDPSEVLPHLAEREPRSAWDTADLVSGDAAAGFAGVAEGRATVAFKKERWRDPIEEDVNRSVWIGPSKQGFSGWLRGAVAEEIAGRLFNRPGGLVLLGDWTSDAVGDGTRVTIGEPGSRPSDVVVDDDVLVKRLDGRGELAKLPAWRLLAVDPQSYPEELREPMQRAVGLTAARLLVEVAEGEGGARPSRTQPTTWTLPATPGKADGDFAGLVALVRWVGDDLGEARLVVARDLAARLIKDPAHDGSPAPLREAANLAYTLSVHSDVRASLDHQQKLEEAFAALDDRVAEMRGKLAEALDGALTKAIAGALTITIASLTSAKVRDWPATIAGVVLAGYLAISIMSVVHVRDDALKRLAEVKTLAGQRVGGLGATLQDAITTWELGLKKRAKLVLWVLSVVAVAVLVGAFVQNGKLMGRDDATPPPITTTT